MYLLFEQSFKGMMDSRGVSDPGVMGVAFVTETDRSSIPSFHYGTDLNGIYPFVDIRATVKKHTT